VAEPDKTQLLTTNFLEANGIPIERLNPLALAEGNAKRPIYQIHKWWARRLGSIFRMITLATFAPEDLTPETIWEQFVTGTDLQGKIVLDPFMGGGTTIVEALRLRARVIGVDINPVAWFITKKEIEPVNLSAVENAFKHLEASAGQRIRELYKTTCPAGHIADVMYFFWVKVATCLTCGTLVELFPNYEISREEKKQTSICPRCYQVNIIEGEYNSQINCHECGFMFDPRTGPASRGQFHCETCGSTQKVLDVVKTHGKPLQTRLHGLEGYCEYCGRFFKRVDADDLSRWEIAKKTYNKQLSKLMFPTQLIPPLGRSDPRPINHGYTHFHDLFNERQLLSLSILLEEILKFQDANVRELMLIAFSDCLDSNNMFCKYEVAWHKISLLFGLHAYHPIERPTENNVWGTKFGRGTFVRCYEKMLRGKAYGQRPFQRLLAINGQRSNHTIPQERAEGNLVDSFDKLLATNQSALLRCQSSTDLSFIPDRSVDAVITDPPYFDNIQYSELADFFYVWLRLGLKQEYPWFDEEHSYNPDEIVKNDNKGKTTNLFNIGLGEVFSECHRVLNDEGVLVFTFHHNQVWAWEGIAHLLMKSGFYISAAPVVRSEGKSGFHSSSGNIRYDCILVCRKQPSNLAAGDWNEIESSVVGDTVNWVERTIDSGMAVTKADVFAILMGQAICQYTSSACNNDLPPLSRFLQKMSKIVDRVTPAKDVADFPGEPIPYQTEARQLALFIAESQAKYNT